MTLISDSVRHDLMNWSRWLNEGPFPHPMPPTHAGSAEGKYVVPSDLSGDPDNPDDEDPPPPRPVDYQRAEHLDKAFRTRLDRLQRAVVASEFPRRERFMIKVGVGESEKWLFNRQAAIRHCGCSARAYREALRQAAVIIGREMELLG